MFVWSELALNISKRENDNILPCCRQTIISYFIMKRREITNIFFLLKMCIFNNWIFIEIYTELPLRSVFSSRVWERDLKIRKLSKKELPSNSSGVEVYKYSKLAQKVKH